MADDFNRFCILQLKRIRWRLSYVPIALRPKNDPRRQILQAGTVTRRGVGGGGGIPYHRRKYMGLNDGD